MHIANSAKNSQNSVILSTLPNKTIKYRFVRGRSISIKKILRTKVLRITGFYCIYGILLYKYKKRRLKNSTVDYFYSRKFYLFFLIFLFCFFRCSRNARSLNGYGFGFNIFLRCNFAEDLRKLNPCLRCKIMHCRK